METRTGRGRGPGRPRADDGALRSVRLQVCLTVIERDLLQKEAQAHRYDYAAEYIRALTIPRVSAP